MTTASSSLRRGHPPHKPSIYLKLSYPSEEDHVAVDWAGLFTSLAVVVGGIVSGSRRRQNKPRWRPTVSDARETSPACPSKGVGFFFSSNSSAPIWAARMRLLRRRRHPVRLRLAVSLGFAFACGLPKPQCLSVTIETCYQNTAIPLAVVLSSFSNYDEDLCASLGAAPLDSSSAERAGAGASTSPRAGVRRGGHGHRHPHVYTR